MSEINLKQHAETFVDVGDKLTSPELPKGKIRDINLKEYFGGITNDSESINVSNIEPLLALSLLDFLVNNLLKDAERESCPDSDYNPHEDPVINRLLDKGLEGNFGDLPSPSKKRTRRSDSPEVSAKRTNIFFGASTFRNTIESPFSSPPISSSSSNSNTPPPSPGILHSKQNQLLTRRFFLKVPPVLNATEYLDRIHQYCQFSTAVYLSSAYYIYKLVLDLKLMKLTKLNVHRLIITAIRVGCKVVEDMKHRQEFIAKIGGLDMEDLLALEISFLFLIEFECQVNQDLMRSLIGYIGDLYSHKVNLGT